MREADTKEVVQWHGHEVTILVWCDPTDIPWDGDGPKPNCEGWDILVKAELQYEGQHFQGDSSLSGCWGDNKYIRDEVKEVQKEALSDLEQELKNLANGIEVKRAKERAFIAQKFLHNHYSPWKK